MFDVWMRVGSEICNRIEGLTFEDPKNPDEDKYSMILYPTTFSINYYFLRVIVPR